MLHGREPIPGIEVPAGEFAVAGDANLVRDGSFRQLLFRATDVADLGDRVDRSGSSRVTVCRTHGQLRDSGTCIRRRTGATGLAGPRVERLNRWVESLSQTEEV